MAYDPDLPAGVPEGETLTTVTHEGDAVEEVIVYDHDQFGNVIGWHKEVAS